MLAIGKNGVYRISLTNLEIVGGNTLQIYLEVGLVKSEVYLGQLWDLGGIDAILGAPRLRLPSILMLYCPPVLPLLSRDSEHQLKSMFEGMPSCYSAIVFQTKVLISIDLGTWYCVIIF